MAGYAVPDCIAISEVPEAPTLDLVVERLDDGEVSPDLTDELRVGDAIELRGPIGGYFVWQAALGGPLQLIAGGSGVAPFLAMLEHHAASRSDAAVRLLLSSKTIGEVICRDRLEQHRQRGVGVAITLTRDLPAGWDGLSGRVTAEMLQRLTFPADVAPQLFICGPTAFVEAVADAAVAIGHAPARIKTDRFGG